MNETNVINFIRYEYNIGDKVMLTHNPCNQGCQCFWESDKAPFLNKNVIYEIEDISYFGGGCPPVLLHLKDVPETIKNDESFRNSVPANWFKPLKN